MSEARLELSEPRRICLHDRGHAFTITCRRVEPADWLAYFNAIAITSEQQGSQRISTMDFDSPRTLLAGRVIINAEGYKVEGGVELVERLEREGYDEIRREVGAAAGDANG